MLISYIQLMLQTNKSRLLVYLMLLFIIPCTPPAYGSVLLDPTCFVELEALEDSKLEAGINKVNFLIKSIVSGNAESVGFSTGDIYRMSVPANFAIRKGTILKAGAVSGGSLAENGKAVRWIHWEPLHDEAGNPLRDNRGRSVLSFSSDSTPISSHTGTSAEQ